MAYGQIQTALLFLIGAEHMFCINYSTWFHKREERKNCNCLPFYICLCIVIVAFIRHLRGMGVNCRFYNKSIDKTAAPVISRRLFSHLFSFSRPVLSLHLVISLFLSYDMDKLNLQPRGDLCILTPGINGLRFFIYTVSLDGSSSPPMFP